MQELTQVPPGEARGPAHFEAGPQIFCTFWVDARALFGCMAMLCLMLCWWLAPPDLSHPLGGCPGSVWLYGYALLDALLVASAIDFCFFSQTQVDC